MSSTLLPDVTQVSVGKNSFTATIATTGNYYVQCLCTETPPSGLTVVVNKNGSPIYTSPTVTPTQGAFQFKFDFPAAATDTITVVPTSSTAIDGLLNTVKMVVTLGTGF